MTDLHPGLLSTPSIRRIPRAKNDDSTLQTLKEAQKYAKRNGNSFFL